MVFPYIERSNFLYINLRLKNRTCTQDSTNTEKTDVDIHVSAIRTHDLSVSADEDSSCLDDWILT
jgi:hypothetical protein